MADRERYHYESTLDSLRHYRTPDWYRNGKLGIFIHWGPYSVSAHKGEWYARNMYEKSDDPDSIYQWHRRNWGNQKEFGYKDFIPMMNGEKFDADEWIQIFKDAGARFVVPVAEHHDGFCMYDSDQTPWNSVAMGPKRDVIAELSVAIKTAGLVFGMSNHHAENYWFFSGGRKTESDVIDPPNRQLYGAAVDSPRKGDLHDFEYGIITPEIQKEWYNRACEMVDKYQPQLMWFDWWINHRDYRPWVRKFAAYYYNEAQKWDKEVVLNYKNEVLDPDTAVLDIERGLTSDICPYFWQCDTSVSKSSWGYTHDQDYKTPTKIIHDFVDIVSKNGNLLLNVGPKPDGTIPNEEKTILREIGKWLNVNGEAIYGTRPWKTFGEGPTKIVEGTFNDVERDSFTSNDIRFTTNEENLYAIVLSIASGPITINSVTEKPKKVELLGYGTIEFNISSEGLTVYIPQYISLKHALCIKLYDNE